MTKVLGGKYYTMADVAMQLGIAYPTVYYRVRNRIYPQPTSKVGRRIYYTEEVFKQILAMETAEGQTTE